MIHDSRGEFLANCHNPQDALIISFKLHTQKDRVHGFAMPCGWSRRKHRVAPGNTFWEPLHEYHPRHGWIVQ